MKDLASTRIGVIGLGYVGLPLAVEFGRHYDTVGYDIDAERIASLCNGDGDRNREVSAEELHAATRLTLTATLDDLRRCGVYIVTVPTPINEHKHPDFTPLNPASPRIRWLPVPRGIGHYQTPG